MKALILAAGLGTRLRPFTHMTPKALFTINGQPLLGAAIEKLSRAGFEGVLVNTHHHHTQIETYLADTSFPIPVAACHEPDILGTGGAIRNVSGLWDDDPLLVINADIVTDLDPAEIYRFHRSHGFPVTMVMHDSPNFNSVDVSDDDFVLQFGCRESEDKNHRVMAFTGIHVLDRRVLDFLPAQGPAHIIDAYGRMLEAGEKIKAYVARNHYWQDIGTPERYQQAVFDRMAPMAFKSAFGIGPEGPIHQHRLHGDGSDRQWYRLEAHGRTLIMVEHGIRNDHGTQEVDAYVHIGRHLAAKAVAVPKIHLNDNFAGVVFLEDLGDEHLELYRSVIDQWVTMAIEGSRDFDPSWTYQTARYDRDVILDKECRYFVEAFVQGHLGWPVTYADLRAEFEKLADDILDSELSGFVHRDFQSRNIMVQKDRIGVIDFQAGGWAPSSTTWRRCSSIPIRH